MIKCLKHSLLIAILGAVLCSNPVHADTLADFEIISKSIGFIKNHPKGSIFMDVLYDPNSRISREHAQEVEGLLSQGVQSKIKILSRKVSSVDEIKSDVIFITRGASSFYKPALKEAVKKRIVTVSTDEACLGAGCVLVVKTKPDVDVFISVATAEKVGIEFSSVFSLMAIQK